MATAAESKLLLAIATSSTVGKVKWDPIASELDCNAKAARERWRAFKAKLPLPADKAVTDAQAKLLLAIIGSEQVTGINWDAVGGSLGCNAKAARERFRAFRAKREKLGQGGNESINMGGSDVSKSAKKGGKAAGTAKESLPKKRKAGDESEEDGAGVSEGGPVAAPAKKRARANKVKKEVIEVKEEDEGEGEREQSDLGEGAEREDDDDDDDEGVFFDAEGYEDEIPEYI